MSYLKVVHLLLSLRLFEKCLVVTYHYSSQPFICWAFGTGILGFKLLAGTILGSIHSTAFTYTRQQ